jgi:hypothetical protein
MLQNTYSGEGKMLEEKHTPKNNSGTKNGGKKSLYKELKDKLIVILLGLSALGTIFPLIANKLNEILDISLQNAFHTVYVVYFITPVALITFKIAPLLLNSLATDKPSKIPKLFVLFVGVFIPFSSFLFFGFAASPLIFYPLLFIGVILVCAQMIGLTFIFIRTQRKSVSSKNKTIRKYSIIFLLILISWFLMFFSHFNLNENSLSKDIYDRLELHEKKWKDIDGIIELNKILLTRKKLIQQYKTPENSLYQITIDKKYFFDFIEAETKNLLTNTPKFALLSIIQKTFEEIISKIIRICNFISCGTVHSSPGEENTEIITLSTKSALILEDIALATKSLSAKAQKKQLKKVLDVVFYSGSLFFTFFLLLLINTLFFSMLKYIDIENSNDSQKSEFYEKNIRSLKNYFALIILLLIPILRTVDSKNIHLDHPIWPMNIPYFIGGGDQIYGPSSRTHSSQFIDKSVSLDGGDLKEVIELLNSIKNCSVETNSTVYENKWKLGILENNTDTICDTTRKSLKKVEENLEQTNQVRNK